MRAIATNWDGNQPGWLVVGVTSTQSKYQPRNLILQLTGLDASGVQRHEVIASGLHLELDRPIR